DVLAQGAAVGEGGEDPAVGGVAAGVGVDAEPELPCGGPAGDDVVDGVGGGVGQARGDGGGGLPGGELPQGVAGGVVDPGWGRVDEHGADARLGVGLQHRVGVVGVDVDVRPVDDRGDAGLRGAEQAEEGRGV